MPISVGLVHVAHGGVVGQHVLEHAGDDLLDDLREVERRRGAGGHRGGVALGVRRGGVIERVVLVELLGVGGGVVEDVDRVPGAPRPGPLAVVHRREWRPALDEGLAGRVGGPAVGVAEPELVVGRVGVRLGTVGPDREDAGRPGGRG